MLNGLLYPLLFLLCPDLLMEIEKLQVNFHIIRDSEAFYAWRGRIGGIFGIAIILGISC